MDDGSKLYSVHIPKTAGTSFRSILKQVYGDENVVRFDVKRDGNAFLEEQDYTEQAIPDYAVIHGHYRLRDLKDIYGMPEYFKAITWVRDPVKRVMSAYNYLTKRLEGAVGQSDVPLTILDRTKRTLIEFARDRRNQNVQQIFVRGLRLDKYAFVGIQEKFDEEVVRLSSILNWEEVPEIVAHNRTGRPVDDIPKEWIEEIRHLNNKDAEVYAKALELREESLKRLERA